MYGHDGQGVRDVVRWNGVIQPLLIYVNNDDS